MIDPRLQRHAFSALLAAALFGASTPLAKLLLRETSPLMLAGLLYLGSGTGLLLLRIAAQRVAAPGAERAARLQPSDYPWLAGAIACGGVAAPALLMWGLATTAAGAASLLLNFESVITALIAAAIFREAVGGRVWFALAIMLAGGLLLSYDPGAALNLSPGALAIVAACGLWALDNNLTRRISAGDAVTIAMAKGLSAGAVNVALALAAGAPAPEVLTVTGAMILGLASYGVSLVLFIHALRHLGSARTGAHFSTAPFFGAGIAVPLLGEPATPAFIAALALMVAATWLILTESHEHEHAHEVLAHSHEHRQDEHHHHAHDGSEGPEPHTHFHVHPPLTHAHPHLPDIHHRHEH